MRLWSAKQSMQLGPLPCQKNRLIMLSIWCCTPFGILKIAIKLMGIAANTDCNRPRRPPRERSRACHPPRRASIFAITGCQLRLCSLPSTKGSLRYQMGSEATGVDNTAEIRANSSSPSQLQRPRTYFYLAASSRNPRICPTWWRRGAPRLSIHG